MPCAAPPTTSWSSSEKDPGGFANGVGSGFLDANHGPSRHSHWRLPTLDGKVESSSLVWGVWKTVTECHHPFLFRELPSNRVIDRSHSFVIARGREIYCTIAHSHVAVDAMQLSVHGWLYEMRWIDTVKPSQLGVNRLARRTFCNAQWIDAGFEKQEQNATVQRR